MDKEAVKKKMKQLYLSDSHENNQEFLETYMKLHDYPTRKMLAKHKEDVSVENEEELVAEAKSYLKTRGVI